MKRIVALFLIVIMLVCAVPVFAEEYTSDSVNVEFYVAPSANFMKTEALFELYNMDDELITSEAFLIVKTGCVYKVKFTVPEYQMGAQFKLKLVKGFVDMQHYDSIVGEGLCVVLSTYTYTPEGADEVVIGDYFGVNCIPYPEQNIEVCVNDNKVQPQFHLKRDSGDILAEASDMMKFFKISQYDYKIGENQIEINHDNKKVIFTADSNIVSVNGENWEWPVPPQYLEGKLYLSAKMMSIIFNAEFSSEDVGEIKNVKFNLLKSRELEARMNNDGLSSKTEYLIWVNKGTYDVNIFTGSQGNWSHAETFKCAIGAPETPTITGTHTYYQWEKAWDYGSYYVGPIMRFYGKGYALHSTKVRYDGTDYDGRTGVPISLGCVRIRPEEMKWMAETIPLHTTIHITEN